MKDSDNEYHPIDDPDEQLSIVLEAFPMSVPMVDYPDRPFRFTKTITPREILEEMTNKTPIGYGFAKFWMVSADVQDKPIGEVLNQLFE